MSSQYSWSRWPIRSQMLISRSTILVEPLCSTLTCISFLKTLALIVAIYWSQKSFLIYRSSSDVFPTRESPIKQTFFFMVLFCPFVIAIDLVQYTFKGWSFNISNVFFFLKYAILLICFAISSIVGAIMNDE